MASEVAQYLDDDGNEIKASPDVKLPAGYSLLMSKKGPAPSKKTASAKELKILAAAKKPIVPPPGYIPEASVSAYTPSVFEQARSSIANSAIGYSLEQALPSIATALHLHPTEKMGTPQAAQHQEQLMAPEYLAPTVTEAIRTGPLMGAPAPPEGRPADATSNIVEGALRGAGGLTSGKSMATMAGIAAATAATAGVINPVSARVLSRLVSGGFTVDMLHGLYQQHKEYRKAVDAGDINEAQKIQGEMGVTGVMTLLTGKHALSAHPVAPPIEEAPHVEASKPVQPAEHHDPQNVPNAVPPVPSEPISGSTQEEEVAPYKYEPIDTSKEVSGNFYHGTKAAINSVADLDPGSHGNEQALYGIGTYLTDNPEVAKGYAKTKGKGPEGKVFPATLDNAKLLNLEQPVSQEAHQVFEKMLQGITGEKESLSADLTGKQLFRRLQEAMQDEGWPRSEAQDALGELTTELRQQGYHGLWHEGGGKVGKGPHNVAIIFPDYGVGRPTTDVVKDTVAQNSPTDASLEPKEQTTPPDQETPLETPDAEQDSPTDLDVNTNTEGEAGEKEPEQVEASTGTGPTTTIPVQGGTQLASAPKQESPVARTPASVPHHVTTNVSVPLKTALDVTPVVTTRILPLSQIKAMAAQHNPQYQSRSVRDLMREAKERFTNSIIP